jgi:beta-glucosidase
MAFGVPQCSVKRPTKELRGFERICLKPAEKRTLTFLLKGAQLAFYNVSKKSFIVEPGVFEVQVGSSSADIRLIGQFEVE